MLKSTIQRLVRFKLECGDRVFVRRQHNRATAQGGILVVEYRDEVFARLAADLGGCGVPIARAISASDATFQLNQRPFQIVLAYISPPDEHAWLMVSRLRSTRLHIKICLYSPWKAEMDRHWCEFTRLDGLIYYSGNLWRLSSELKSWLGSHKLMRFKLNPANEETCFHRAA